MGSFLSDTREDCKEFKMYRKGKDKKFLIFQLCVVTNLSDLAALVYIPFVFWEKFPTAEFRMISAETPCWEKKENSQIFNEDFFLPLYLPLCIGQVGPPSMLSILIVKGDHRNDISGWQHLVIRLCYCVAGPYMEFVLDPSIPVRRLLSAVGIPGVLLLFSCLLLTVSLLLLVLFLTALFCWHSY
jgi:hypothetical protein